MIVQAIIQPGTISAPADISGSLQASADFTSTVYVSTAEDYTGPYEVTSFTAAPLLTTSLVLPTADKHMMDDLTIYSVPTREEPNEAGGVTFIVGG